MRSLARAALAVALSGALVFTTTFATADPAPAATGTFTYQLFDTPNQFLFDPEDDVCIPLALPVAPIVFALNETNRSVFLYPTEDCTGEAAGLLFRGESDTFNFNPRRISVKFVT